MAKAWVVDRWHKIDKTSSQRARTAQYGSGSRWRVDWYEDQPDGTKRLRSKSFKNKSGNGSAEEFATSTDNAMRAGVYSPAENAKRKFAEIASEYLDSKQSIKPSHRYRLERDLRTWVNPKWGARGIGTIKRSEVEGWVIQLQSGQAPHSYVHRSSEPAAGGLSPSSIKGIVILASSILKYASRHGLIQANPADGVERPRVVKKTLVILDHVEVENLADAALSISNDANDRALVLTLGYIGLRINEALALQVGSVDLDRRRAAITQTWSQGSERHLGLPKSGEVISVSIPAFLAEELRPLIANQPDDAFVFRARRGGDIRDSNWRNRVWSKAVAATNLGAKRPTPHDLRHAAASMMIASGADVKVIQSQLGHTRATETLDTYGFLWPDRLDIVSDAVEIARRLALEASGARPVIMTES